MYVYLAKKIQFPDKTQMYCVAWNAEAGYIAVGGDRGLLKVLKLESGQSKQASNLSMNVTCDGHGAPVKCVAWNEVEGKLTSSDTNGLIICWQLCHNAWLDQMSNDRKRSTVRDLRWTADGRKIVIVYEDGHVIVGAEDGRRVWGKDLGVPLAKVEWSPNGRHLVMGLQNTEVQLYDGISGHFLATLPTSGVPAENRETAHVVGIHWYDGTDGYLDPSAPTLALGFSDGTVILMRSEADDTPIVFQTGVAMTTMRWNWQGTVLAVGGIPTQNDPLRSPTATPKGQIRFFDPYGKSLRVLQLQSSSPVVGLTWEGSGLRLALAVDAHIFFANVRPAYQWAMFGKTLVYAYQRPDRADMSVVFWNTKWDRKYTKRVRRLLQVRAAYDTCMLVTRSDQFAPPTQLGGATASGENEDLTDRKGVPHVVVLCNEIGAPVDSKYVDLRPTTSALSEHFAVVCSEDVVYVWQFRSIVTKHDMLDPHAGTSITQRAQEQRDRVFHIEETVQPWPADMTQSVKAVTAASFTSANTLAGQARGADPITCCTISKTCILIGRESGVVHQYGLPTVGLVNKFVVSPRPQQLALNMSGSTLAVIDSNSLLTFYTMQPVNIAVGFAGVPQPAERVGPERKEVWGFLWAEDDDRQFATMEKQRLVLFRDFEASEPQLTNNYLASFKDLKVKTVALDEVMLDPEHPPRKESLQSFPTKLLADTQNMLQQVEIQDAMPFVSASPHPRLWRLLGEASLQKMDFALAERAFVQCEDYFSLQVLKRIRALPEEWKQKAEVAIYFKRYSEAELLYRDNDRKVLAVELQERLEDWFQVVALIQESGADDDKIPVAYNNIGDYYADHRLWGKAVEYYNRARNYEKIVDFLYILEDYQRMKTVAEYLPSGTQLLVRLGDKFASVGFCENAVAAYVKGGEPQKAVDCCIELNRWDIAKEVAAEHKIPDVDIHLTAYATKLVEKNNTTHAIELYRKARQHASSAKLLAQLGKTAGGQGLPLRAKKFYVLSAIEVDRNKAHLVDLSKGDKLVDGLLAHDQATAEDRSLDNAWRGAEAYHWLLLCQRQLYAGELRAALVTAMRLAQYDDLLDEKQVYGLIALTGWYAEDWACSSSGFIRLEALSDEFKELAVQIFTRYPPKALKPAGTFVCNGRDGTCETELFEWENECRECGQQLYACVATGQLILPTQPKKKVLTCRTCLHRMYSTAVDKQQLQNCPLCHHPLQA